VRDLQDQFPKADSCHLVHGIRHLDRRQVQDTFFLSSKVFSSFTYILQAHHGAPFATSRTTSGQR
jgi:hypothetical protein